MVLFTCIFSQYNSVVSFSDLERLPYSIRVLLESVVRNCDGFHVTEQDVQNVYNWEKLQTEKNATEISFKPARVILQDFTGVPALVDFAAMRDAVDQFGADPLKINPICPADLVIDHSVQVDFFRRYSILFIISTFLFCTLVCIECTSA